MDTIQALSQRVAGPLMRMSMGLTVFWIGMLKFADPTPVVGLLGASLPFLAFDGVVYVLGAIEVAAAIALFAGVATRYVGVLLVGLFAGTLTIFVIAPMVSYGEAGFPFLTLAGEFLLKDLVLLAASVGLVATEAAPAAVLAAAGHRRATIAASARLAS